MAKKPLCNGRKPGNGSPPARRRPGVSDKAHNPGFAAGFRLVNLTIKWTTNPMWTQPETTRRNRPGLIRA